MNRRLSLMASAALVLLFVALSAFHREASANAPAGVTFTKDVAPIFYKNCAACHRPGEIAPMSLVTYKDALRIQRTHSRATRQPYRMHRAL